MGGSLFFGSDVNYCYIALQLLLGTLLIKIFYTGISTAYDLCWKNKA